MRVRAGGLPERELQGLLEIIGEVNHAEDVQSFREGLLHVLPNVVPSIYTSYNEISSDGRPVVAIVSPELDESWIELWGRLGHENPLVQRHLSSRNSRALRLSDVIDEASFRRLALYREVFAPLGVNHQMAVTLPAPPSLLVGFAVTAEHDYTDAQQRMFDLARPHLIQARANAAARERLRDVLDAVSLGLEDINQALVIADDRDRITFATLPGRDVLERLGERHVDGSPVPAALRTVSADNTTIAIADLPQLRVRRLRGASGTTVYLFDRLTRPTPLDQIEALGLTTREAEVLRCLMHGESTAATAATLGVSPRTVHKHSERIYRKLGVGDRVAAVSAAWSALDAGRSPAT
jgi:DNA-binding CsgD family transcriptional regulator